jgi:hypothetical protein
MKLSFKFSNIVKNIKSLNKSKIIFPFVTLIYIILFITFNLINKKNDEYDETKLTVIDKTIIRKPPIKLYKTLREKNLLVFFPFIHTISDGYFYNDNSKTKNGLDFFLMLIVILLGTTIVEYLVGHKLLILYILVAIFNRYFSDIHKYYILNIDNKFVKPTEQQPSCCGSSIYCFLAGVGLLALFKKYKNIKFKIFIGLVSLGVLATIMMWEYNNNIEFIQYLFKLNKWTKYLNRETYKYDNNLLLSDAKKEARKAKYLLTWHTQFYLTGIIIAALTI